jgi:hypothetical protein
MAHDRDSLVANLPSLDYGWCRLLLSKSWQDTRSSECCRTANTIQELSPRGDISPHRHVHGLTSCTPAHGLESRLERCRRTQLIAAEQHQDRQPDTTYPEYPFTRSADGANASEEAAEATSASATALDLRNDVITISNPYNPLRLQLYGSSSYCISAILLLRPKGQVPWIPPAEKGY